MTVFNVHEVKIDLSRLIAEAEAGGDVVIAPVRRMLMAQARLEGLPLVSNETVFDGFGVTRIW